MRSNRVVQRLNETTVETKEMGKFRVITKTVSTANVFEDQTSPPLVPQSSTVQEKKGKFNVTTTVTPAPTVKQPQQQRPQTPPAAKLILKAAGVPKGSGTPHTVKAGSITKDQVREIAETKMPDLSANDVDAPFVDVDRGGAGDVGVGV